MFPLERIKTAFFEIFAAGFQSGYMRDFDIVTAYENWWKATMEEA